MSMQTQIITSLNLAVLLQLAGLAIAASCGDAVARARAQILVDRINEVRGTKPGDQYFVRLSDYPKEELLPVEPRTIEIEDVILDESSWEYGDPNQQREKKTFADKSEMSVPAPDIIEYEDVLLDESFNGPEP